MNKQKLVMNWVKKARADLKVAEDELKTIDPENNVVGFLFQQFVEKYLNSIPHFQIRSGKDYGFWSGQARMMGGSH